MQMILALQLYPMQLKSHAHETLSTFIHNIGILSSLHSNNAQEIMQGKFKELCKDYHIQSKYSVPYSPWQNQAEYGIKELKKHVRRKMKSNNVPNHFWDFFSKWTSDVIM